MPYTKNYLLLDVVSAYYELDAFLIPKDPSSVADLDEEYEGFTFTPLKEGKISFRIYLYDQNSNVLYSTDADFYCFLPTKSNLDVNIYSGSPEFGKAFTHTDINARFNPYQDLYGYAVFDENNNIVAYPYSRWRSHFSVIIDERYNNKPGKYTFIGIIYDEAFYYVKKDFEILN